jgi:hypothetical protein
MPGPISQEAIVNSIAMTQVHLKILDDRIKLLMDKAEKSERRIDLLEQHISSVVETLISIHQRLETDIKK